MSFRVHFDHSPVYELILSFMIYSRRKWTRNLDIGSAWLKKVDEAASPKFRTDSGKFGEDTFEYLFLLTYVSPNSKEIPEFLQWLGAQSPGRLYELLSQQTAGSLPSDLGDTMQEAGRLLSTWNDIYFNGVNREWLAIARNDAAQRQAVQSVSDPLKLIEAATGGVVLEAEGLIDIVLAPVVHFRPLNTYALYKTLGIILYPVDPPEHGDNPPVQLMRVTRALSDESRIRILRYLAPSPRSFTEVVAHTKLSKGTVHHHMMALRAAGLIRTHINRGQQSHERFSIRPDGVSEFTAFLREYAGF
ncbi:ArsR/SmtB family transcription factor [Paenibacillus thermotolerans]|uniref:ArsR/SmtB family transcription factor n=1 Tax=Paenibacillus thermotolerans TaxID=3027807 RepID=UPI002367DCEC|nr:MULTISPECIES: winged helix-turn-helix domain-containing protein [unclassified Paenibacillus]